jgi:hypothetical protein
VRTDYEVKISIYVLLNVLPSAHPELDLAETLNIKTTIGMVSLMFLKRFRGLCILQYDFFANRHKVELSLEQRAYPKGVHLHSNLLIFTYLKHTMLSNKYIN